MRISCYIVGWNDRIVVFKSYLSGGDRMKWLREAAEEITKEMKCEKCGGGLKISEELSKENDIVFSCSICGNTEYSYGTISEAEKMKFAKEIFGKISSNIGIKTCLCN